jgi:hypothetical protein
MVIIEIVEFINYIFCKLIKLNCFKFVKGIFHFSALKKANFGNFLLRRHHITMLLKRTSRQPLLFRIQTIKNQLQKFTRNSASMFEKILASLPPNGVSLYLSIRLLLSAENYFSKKKHKYMIYFLIKQGKFIYWKINVELFRNSLFIMSCIIKFEPQVF